MHPEEVRSVDRFLWAKADFYHDISFKPLPGRDKYISVLGITQKSNDTSVG